MRSRAPEGSHRLGLLGSALIVLAGLMEVAIPSLTAQEELIVRPGPPAVDNLETDANKDGLPDGWYNARDVKWMTEGGAPGVGPHFVRFECTQRGRPSRLSLAFGVDGRKTEAIRIGLWVRVSHIQIGERQGDEPGLTITLSGEGLRAVRRTSLGPWTHLGRDRWTRVVKRIPIPPSSRDLIMTVGLLGATGTFDIDGLTFDLVPVAGEPTQNLVVNGDFELGDPSPTYWLADKDVHRVFPGDRSSAAVELGRAKSRLYAGLGIPVEPFPALDVAVSVRCTGLRGGGGAAARFFFLDDFGKPLPGHETGDLILLWSGSNNWREDQAQVNVPRGAVRAVLQIEKSDSLGTIRIDNVRVTAAPNPDAGAWLPFHVVDETNQWLAVPTSASIVAKSALDVSFLLTPPAGRNGFVTVKKGRLAFANGEGRARFFGVNLLAPTAFLEPEPADQLADRLARSGVNLVRLGDLDTALGPSLSLFDDTRDDTKALDLLSLAKLDHLIAALKARGIYVAIELQSKRQFRSDDGVSVPGLLPPGGGPAAQFDPTLSQLELEAARALLDHVNLETGLALRDDPVLAWVTLAGEVSLFNLLDEPDALPAPYDKALRALSEKSTSSVGLRFWESVESAHSKQMAAALRKNRVRVPIAGVSHWRREKEFVAAQAGAGLDLIDDRLYWSPPIGVAPDVRSTLWSLDNGLAALADYKRRLDRPYVVGQWCNLTSGAWSYPHEAADQLLGVYTAMVEDWDALVRRGVFLYPQTWGDGPAGTVGGEDIFQVAQAVNGSPHIYGLWPHAASLMLRGRSARSDREHRPTATSGRAAGKARVPGWDPAHGRLVIDTPYTQGFVGWIGGATASFDHLEFSTENQNPFAVLIATSVTPEPIATTKRLLVSVMARVEPTGLRWVDYWKRDVAEPGRPPFLQEPVAARILWMHKGPVHAHVLNNAGERVGAAKLEPRPGGEGHTLIIDGTTAAFHWELIAD
jgi:hypothetical protein